MAVIFNDIHDIMSQGIIDNRVINANFDEVLFADDAICISENANSLINLLHLLQHKGVKYGLQLNMDKCELIRISRAELFTDEDLVGFSGDAYSTFPRGYSAQKPTFDYLNHERVVGQLRGDPSVKFESQDFAKKIVMQKLRGNNIFRFATLTTREIERDDVGKTRQPKREIWEGVFEALREKGITPIVVRDTACAFGGKSLFDGVLEFPEASLNPQVRLALYEQSEINFTKNNGPGFLQLFAHNRAIYFNAIAEGVSALSSKWFENGYGMSVKENAQYPMTTNNVIFRWGDESFELALTGFEELSSVCKSC